MGKWIALAFLGLPAGGMACGPLQDAQHLGRHVAADPVEGTERPAAARWLNASIERALPMSWPAPEPGPGRWVTNRTPEAAETEQAALETTAYTAQEVCRAELRRQAIHPDSIQILKWSPLGAPVGATGLAYLFSGKNRFGWSSQWRTHCQVAADGRLLRFRTVLVPDW